MKQTAIKQDFTEYAVIHKPKLLADITVCLNLIETGQVALGAEQLARLKEWIRQDTYTGLLWND